MISIIIPLLNEEANLELLYKRIIGVFAKRKEDFEIIFIDDGSTDNSLDILKSLSSKDKRIKVFSFRRNLGKAEALTLGFRKASGSIIVTLDADLQDRPEEIEKLIFISKQGYDLVCGWRKHRQDASKMITASKIFNFITSKLWGLHLHDYNCGLKLYSNELAKELNLYGGMHRFIPLIAFQDGFRVGEVEIIHDKRLYGKSKYGFSKMWKDLPDLFSIFFLTRFGKRPLHFFGFVGSFLSLIGLLFLCYLTVLHYFYNEHVGTRPLWSVGVLFTLVGLQISFTGFLADLILHTVQENNSNTHTNDKYIKFSSETV